MNPLMIKAYRACSHANREQRGDFGSYCLDCRSFPDYPGAKLMYLETLMPLEEAVLLAHTEATGPSRFADAAEAAKRVGEIGRKVDEAIAKLDADVREAGKDL